MCPSDASASRRRSASSSPCQGPPSPTHRPELPSARRACRRARCQSVTTSPGLCVWMAFTKSSEVSTFCPPIAWTTSPSFRPAAAAAELGTTSSTVSDPCSSLVPTPRKAPEPSIASNSTISPLRRPRRARSSCRPRPSHRDCWVSSPSHPPSARRAAAPSEPTSNARLGAPPSRAPNSCHRIGRFRCGSHTPRRPRARAQGSEDDEVGSSLVFLVGFGRRGLSRPVRGWPGPRGGWGAAGAGAGRWDLGLGAKAWDRGSGHAPGLLINIWGPHRPAPATPPPALDPHPGPIPSPREFPG